jgi:hypothetical protein
MDDNLRHQHFGRQIQIRPASTGGALERASGAIDGVCDAHAAVRGVSIAL